MNQRSDRKLEKRIKAAHSLAGRIVVLILMTSTFLLSSCAPARRSRSVMPTGGGITTDQANLEESQIPAFTSGTREYPDLQPLPNASQLDQIDPNQPIQPQLAKFQSDTLNMKDAKILIDRDHKTMRLTAKIGVGDQLEPLVLEGDFSDSVNKNLTYWSSDDLKPVDPAVRRQRRVQATALCTRANICDQVVVEIYYSHNGKLYRQQFEQKLQASFQDSQKGSDEAFDPNANVDSSGSDVVNTAASKAAPAAASATTAKSNSTDKLNSSAASSPSHTAEGSVSSGQQQVANVAAAQNQNAANTASKPLSSKPGEQKAAAGSSTRQYLQSKLAKLRAAGKKSAAPMTPPKKTAQPATTQKQVKVAEKPTAPTSVSKSGAAAGSTQVPTAQHATQSQTQLQQSATQAPTQLSKQPSVTAPESDPEDSDATATLEIPGEVVMPLPKIDEDSPPELAKLTEVRKHAIEAAEAAPTAKVAAPAQSLIMSGNYDLGMNGADPRQAKNSQAHGGALVNASQLLASKDGSYIGTHPKNEFGTETVVNFIVRAAEALLNPGRSALIVGDVSVRNGGGFGHESHRNGLDADIGFLSLDPSQKTFWVPFTRSGSKISMSAKFDDERVWKFLKLAFHYRKQKIEDDPIANGGSVMAIFTDTAIRSHLCHYAQQIGEPIGDKESDAFTVLNHINYWPQHENHFHVRFTCPLNNYGCQNSFVPTYTSKKRKTAVCS